MCFLCILAKKVEMRMNKEIEIYEGLELKLFGENCKVVANDEEGGGCCLQNKEGKLSVFSHAKLIAAIHQSEQEAKDKCENPDEPTPEVELSLEDFEHLIGQWHSDRNLIDGSDDKSQFCKLSQECGELSDNICKGKDIRDDIGDIIVVLINIAKRNGLTLNECMQTAYDDIKDRTGQMVDGVFVKENDLK